MLISIESFNKAFNFAKQADCRDFATIQSMCRMLGCKPFAVMEYINTYPQLVHCEERFENRPKGGKKSLGLCVCGAYTSAEQNPWEPEWLKWAKKHYRKTVWVSEWNNYGVIEGHYLAEDTRPKNLREGEIYIDNRKNEFIWRNTHEKLEACKALGATKETKFFIGGYGDCSENNIPYAIASEGIKILEENGWNVIDKWF